MSLRGAGTLKISHHEMRIELCLYAIDMNTRTIEYAIGLIDNESAQLSRDHADLVLIMETKEGNQGRDVLQRHTHSNDTGRE